jgi:hypothetical protein
LAVTFWWFTNLWETLSVEEILRQAEGLEKEYDWLAAAELYEKALGLSREDDFSRMGTIYERLAFASFRFAFQAETGNEFRERLGHAVLNYEKARDSYRKLRESMRTPKVLRCDAMIAYIGFWLAPSVVEKKKLANDCWTLAKECMKDFEEMGNYSEYGKTYIQLSSSAIFMFTREEDFKSRENIMREAVESGEKAIQFLSGPGDPFELARAYARTVVCEGVFGYYFQDVNEREKYQQKGLRYWAKAKELSEEAAMIEFAYPVFGGQLFFGLEGTDEAVANYEKAREYGKKTRDKFITGCALDWLTYHTGWKIIASEDPDVGNRLIERAVQYAEEAKHQFSIMSFVSPRGDLAWLEGIEVACLMWSAGHATDLKKKRQLYDRVLQAFPSARKRGEESGYPEIRMYMCLSEAGFLVQLAQSETNLIEKKRILEDALSQGNKSYAIAEKLEPFVYWNRGIMRIMLSVIRTELANLAEKPEIKKTLLLEAIIENEDATKLLMKELTFLEEKGTAPSLFSTIGEQHFTYGNLLLSLYETTRDRMLLGKATKAYEDAIEFFQKLNLVTSIAGAYWKKAQGCGKLGEHISAYQSFELARANFAFASERIPALRDFYNDQAIYMHAWSQIEKAREHHEKQEYGLAEEHFEKASKLHERVQRWKYLSPNYAAWAQMDHAEELSRSENSEDALKAFETAATFFEETRKSIQNQIVKIENFEEKQMAKSILKSIALRQQYCMARIAVEEAKIFDKKGDHFSSSERYKSAAESLAKITEVAESEQDTRELMLVTTLSQAWAKMTLAEAEENPDPYLEASQLFEKAKELSSNEKTRTLVLGHSRFCRALEAGMRFADTGDETLHATAIQHLESAGKYYVKAGYQSASEYAKATELLLDAYSTINKAKREADPEKKPRLLAVAEKILQTSAGYFMKAEHPEKREQVLRLLEKVNEERELAQSLNEVLHTPSIVSTTTAFTTLTPGQESSVGSEKLENANIQANVTARPKQMGIGEHLELEVELVNAGKGPAQLIKIIELIPPGFELVEKPEFLKVEDSYVDLKGKRLGALKTEELGLVLKPKVQGNFTLKPTILYLDENNKYKSCTMEPIDIKVKELGIRGWLKGEE